MVMIDPSHAVMLQSFRYFFRHRRWGKFHLLQLPMNKDPSVGSPNIWQTSWMKPTSDDGAKMLDKPDNSRAEHPLHSINANHHVITG
jgi:hypothetical protein